MIGITLMFECPGVQLCWLLAVERVFFKFAAYFPEANEMQIGDPSVSFPLPCPFHSLPMSTKFEVMLLKNTDFQCDFMNINGS